MMDSSQVMNATCWGPVRPILLKLTIPSPPRQLLAYTHQRKPRVQKTGPCAAEHVDYLPVVGKQCSQIWRQKSARDERHV
jgi:hypothetical protein